MATGLDAVGLALAMLPMVVQLLGTYSGRVKNEELAFLNLSLRNTERIYKNAVEDLLKEIISSAEIRQLLEDPEGARWHDSNLSARLADHLGGHSEEMFETARQIAETMKKLKENLPVGWSKSHSLAGDRNINCSLCTEAGNYFVRVGYQAREKSNQAVRQRS